MKIILCDRKVNGSDIHNRISTFSPEMKSIFNRCTLDQVTQMGNNVTDEIKTIRFAIQRKVIRTKLLPSIQIQFDKNFFFFNLI